MTHYSKVAPSVFEQIKSGHKIIEPRLNDAVHRHVKLGDLIVIINRQTNQEVVSKVVGVLRYKSFDDLFAAFPARYFGVEDVPVIKQEVAQWYSTAAEQEHGVLGIKLHVLRAHV
jgi:ASC-1-like (ASCH) protein